ncbi:TPA: hypothetical protein ACH3X2_004046 [Trebouxia sp. C0005]
MDEDANRSDTANTVYGAAPFQSLATAGRGRARDTKLPCKVTSMLVGAEAVVVAVQASMQSRVMATKAEASARRVEVLFMKELILPIQTCQVHRVARKLPSRHDCWGRSMVCTKVQLLAVYLCKPRSVLGKPKSQYLYH